MTSINTVRMTKEAIQNLRNEIMEQFYNDTPFYGKLDYLYRICPITAHEVEEEIKEIIQGGC